MNAYFNSFVETERNRFEIHDNNRFAMSFGQILKYREFLSIIVERHAASTAGFTDAMERLQAATTQSGKMSSGQSAIYEEWGRYSTLIHFELESYYLFAKVLIDKVARFLEFYFGPERGLSFDSHDQLTKSFSTLVDRRGLVATDRIQQLFSHLKTTIADYRDYQIAHEKNPRMVRGITFTKAGVSMVATHLYPKSTDSQAQSGTIQELERSIDEYLHEVVELLRANSDRTRLVLVGA